ncbi:tetratricopeptide repeat protein, partial [Bacillus thuringiensis]
NIPCDMLLIPFSLHFNFSPKTLQQNRIVHEDIKTTEIYNCYFSDIVVTHKKEEGSSNRNLQIYESAMKNGKKLSPQDLFHYARELQVNKRYREAIEYHELFLRSQKELSTELVLFTYHNLACCYFQIDDFEKELDFTLHSFKHDIPQPVFCCRMGEHFIKQKKYKQAIFWYSLAIKDENESSQNLIEHFIYKTWLPHKQLGFCYRRLNQYELSYSHNKKVLEYLPDDIETIEALNALEKIILS